MLVVGIVGLPASGKGEFSRIAAEMGVPVVVMGDVIRNAVREAGLPPTDENMGLIANQLRKAEGMDAVAHRCVPLVKSRDAPLVLIDGIRGDAEVKIFRREFARFCLIGIDSEFPLRLSRVKVRGRSDDLKNAGELKVRDERELAWGLGRALAEADITIPNNGTLEEYARDVRALIGKLEGGT
ncbi:MAG: dephospho-CoA kinase [Methanoregulaceae archaeon]